MVFKKGAFPRFKGAHKLNAEEVCTVKTVDTANQQKNPCELPVEKCRMLTGFQTGGLEWGVNVRFGGSTLFFGGFKKSVAFKNPGLSAQYSLILSLY